MEIDVGTFQTKMMVCEKSLFTADGLIGSLTSPILLWYLVGLLGILGWGALGEKLLFKKNHIRISDSFLLGIPLLSILLFLLHAMRLCSLTHVPAILGAGFAIGFSRRFLIPRRGLIWAVLVISLPVVFYISAVPLAFGDQTSIWVLHAKELACSCLYQTSYIRESVWSHSHSEYPLLFPLVDSYFFRLSGSFRDDIVKIWLSLLVLATLRKIYFGLMPSHGKSLALCASVLYLTLVVSFSTNFMQGAPELVVASYLAIALTEWKQGGYLRIPFFLFAIAFTKNEGLAIAGCFFLILCVERKLSPRVLLSIAALLFVDALIIGNLPSNHEQYPSHLSSLSSWIVGLTRLPTILDGMNQIFGVFPFIGLFYAILPVCLIYLVARNRRTLCGMRDSRILLLAATLLMLLIFLGIYMVTPWGPELWRVTFARLLSEIYFFAAFFVLDSVLAMRRDGFRLARFLFAIVFVYHSVAVIKRSGEVFLDVKRAFSEGKIGISAYWQHPTWKIAQQLDEKLPPAARGAIVKGESYLPLTYMMFPRRFYPNDPNIGLPATQWSTWSSVSEGEMEKFGFAFVISGETFEVIKLKSPLRN